MAFMHEWHDMLLGWGDIRGTVSKDSLGHTKPPINITVQLYFRHKIETALQLALIKLTVSLFKYS